MGPSWLPEPNISALEQDRWFKNRMGYICNPNPTKLPMSSSQDSGGRNTPTNVNAEIKVPLYEMGV